MKDYKVELYGWECHIKAKNISGDDFDMAVKFDDPHEVEEMLIEDGECDFECSDLFDNDNVFLKINNLDQEHTVECNDDIWDNAPCLDPENSNDYENTLLIINEYKGSCLTYNVSSEDPPNPEDFSYVAKCVETSIGDFELISGLTFKGERLDHLDFESGKSKSFYVKLCSSSGGDSITIE